MDHDSLSQYASACPGIFEGDPVERDVEQDHEWVCAGQQQ